MADTFVDRLVPVLSRGDLVAAYELLHDLDGAELREAQTWFAGSRRWFRELGAHVTYAGEDHDARFATRHEAEWIVGMCAVLLCGPRTAAERVPWQSLRDWTEHNGEAAFVQLLWDRPREWVAEFVDAASRVGWVPRARTATASLSRALRAAAVHHGLPCPTGNTFLKAWYAGTPLMRKWQWQMDSGSEGLAAWLAVDPFMPELLLGYLAAGESGDLPELPGAVGRLVRSGSVERSAVLALVLELLTTSQRPKSQRVLAGILAELEIRADEVPGGLTYLLGVLSTADRAVQPVLLPVAIVLMTDAEGCRQLTDVVAARPEKKPKELLLAALGDLRPSSGLVGRRWVRLSASSARATMPPSRQRCLQPSRLWGWIPSPRCRNRRSLWAFGTMNRRPGTTSWSGPTTSGGSGTGTPPSARRSTEAAASWSNGS